MRKPTFCICEHKDADQLQCWFSHDAAHIILDKHNKAVTGRFAPKPVLPGTIRSKPIFRTGRFAPFVKNEIIVF